MTRLIRPAALLFIIISILPAAADSAKSLYNRGKDAEQRQDYEKAYDFYKQAYDQKPKDLQFRAAQPAGGQSVKTHLPLPSSQQLRG